MHVFLTGATGFIGTALIAELRGAGHRVTGLARTDAGAAALTAAGVAVRRGSLEDVDSLRAGAAAADATIHLAFIHDFSKFAENCEKDRRAIAAMGEALAGSNRPLLMTSGTGIASGVAGRPIREDDAPANAQAIPRAASEELAAALAARGVNIGVVRLPQVHDPVKQGLISYAIRLAKEKGRAAYLGDGRNRWAAVHVSDAARLYRLALEQATPGARYHAVGEEGVAMRDIAEAIGRGLGVPVVSLSPQEAPGYFGWLAMFAGHDMPATSEWTRKRLGWNPTGPGLMADLARMDFSAV